MVDNNLIPKCSITIEELDRTLAVLAATITERFKAQETALTVALSASEKRLDSLNEFRAALSDQTNRMMSRAEAISAMDSANSKNSAEVETLRTRLDAYGRPNYVLSVTAISAIFGLVAGLWVVIGLKVDNSIAPVTVLVEQLRTGQTTQDRQISSLNDQMAHVIGEQSTLQTQNAQSIIDREQLNSRQHQFEVQVPNATAESRVLSSALAERITRVEAWLEPLKTRMFSEVPTQPPVNVNRVK